MILKQSCTGCGHTHTLEVDNDCDKTIAATEIQSKIQQLIINGHANEINIVSHKEICQHCNQAIKLLSYTKKNSLNKNPDQKLRLGCTALHGLIEYARDSFEVVEPILDSNGKATRQNFDYLFLYDVFSGEYTNFQALAKDKIFGGPRFPKSMQSFLLKKLSIPTPQLFHRHLGTKSSHCGDVYGASVQYEGKYYYKVEMGALGYGHAILEQDELYTISDLKEEEIISLLKTTHPDAIKQAQGKYFTISEFIDNIAHEYRIVLSCTGEAIVLHRVNKKINEDKDGMHVFTYIPEYHNDNHAMVIKELCKGLLKNLVDLYNYPWLSIDLYFKDDGTFGVFEFQMQFGYFNHDKNSLQSFIVDSINYRINELKTSATSI